MRNVVLSMMTTVNGRLDDPLAWLTDVSEELYVEIDRVYETFDTILVGHTTYDEMAAYWPGAATDPAAAGSAANARMARKMNAYQKYVVSGGALQPPLTWHNAELVIAHGDDDLARFVSDLKSRPGKDIHLAGGARLAQSFVRLGLVDAYHFYVHPAISRGAAWFDTVAESRRLELLSASALADGVVALHYRPLPTADAAPPTRFTDLLT